MTEREEFENETMMKAFYKAYPIFNDGAIQDALYHQCLSTFETIWNMAFDEAIKCADDVRLKLAENYTYHLANGTSNMTDNNDWSKLFGAVSVVDELRYVKSLRKIS